MHVKVDPSDLKDFTDWIRFTMEMLVEDPDSLVINVAQTGENLVTFKVLATGPRNEVGKIFGKEKITLLALRRIAFAIARRMGAERVEILIKSSDEEVASNSKSAFVHT